MPHVVKLDDDLIKNQDILDSVERIQTCAPFRKWKKSGATETKTLPVEKAIGIAAIPVALFWVMIAVAIGLGLSLGLLLFKLMAFLWPGR